MKTLYTFTIVMAKKKSHGTQIKTKMKTKMKNDIAHQPGHSLLRTLQLSAIVLVIFGAGGQVFGQSRLTSPPSGWPIPHPSFTLSWNNVSASEHFVYLGSRQGLNDYFGASTGRNTSISLAWQVNRPAGVWVRIWSRVRMNSGFANSTWSGAEQWLASDSYHPMAQPPSNNAPALIESFLSMATAGRQGENVGECKAFLQGVFNRAAANFRLSNGASPIMPPNLNGNNTTTTNWKWQDHSNSGFVATASVDPNATNSQGRTIGDAEKRLRVLALLRQVRRGDVIQLVWKRSVSFNGTQTSHYGPHTMAFLQDYRDMTSAMSVVHSNMDGRGSLQIGTNTTWGAITPASLADRIAAQMGGGTLYRVRPDIQRR